MASTASRSLDIFGKPLDVTKPEETALGSNSELVVLRRLVQAETHVKRGDPTEPKTLIVTSSRCFILSHRPAIKVETSFNFLKIKLLECHDNKLSFHLDGENKGRELLADRKDCVTIVGLILGQLRNLFPITPLESLIKVSYSSESLNCEVGLLHETLRQAMESLDHNSLESFITVYGFLCDLHGLPYLKEISSYLRIAYFTHGFRNLDLNDFEHIPMKDLFPLVSALKYSQYFDGFSVEGMKLIPEISDELSQILLSCHSLKKFQLVNCPIKLDVLFQNCSAWKGNSKISLTHLNLSKNQLDERMVDSLCMGLEYLQHGLQSLSLSGCKITPKSGALIAQAMKANPTMVYSLTHLDLSDNPLGSDSSPALSFIQDPQTISSLNLSKCGINFESGILLCNFDAISWSFSRGAMKNVVADFSSVLQGCQQHLRDLYLSQNRINIRKGQMASVAQSIQQFFSSAISLKVIDMSDCKLTHELAVAIMEGLLVNPNIQDTSLNMNNNDLGNGMDVRAAANAFSRLKNVTSLYIANTGIDQNLFRLVESLLLNKTIHHLSIGQNFEGKGNSKIELLSQLCRLLKSNDCCLQSLDVSDSKLRELTPQLLSSLIGNSSITKLDISGNLMGTPGVRALVKLILSGTQLKELQIGNNDISAAGFTYIADALEQAVIKDVDIDKPLGRIQSYLCRNHSDARTEIELAKRHQLRLLTTSQQSGLISREIVQVEEMLTKLSKHSKKPPGYDKEVSRANGIKEEANKVLHLVDSLYSPQVQSQQCEAIVSRIQGVLDGEVDQAYKEFVQENIEKMVTQSVKACPTFLDDTNREALRQIGSRELQNELSETKKAVTKKTSPEIINHISAVNLEAAAVISELIVDRTLDELEGCTGRLHNMMEAKTDSPSKRVSRIFSFRTKDQESPHAKRRRRGDEEEDGVTLPTKPLSTDGPTLQHLGAQRPRPARKHRHRPAATKQQTDSEEVSVWKAPPTTSDDTDGVPPEKTPVDEIKEVTVDVKSSKPPLSPPKTPPLTPPKTPPVTPPKTPPPKTPPKTPPAAKPPANPTPSPTPTPEPEDSQDRKSISNNTKKNTLKNKLFGSRKEKGSSPSPVPPEDPNETKQDVKKQEEPVVDKSKNVPPPVPKNKPPRPKSTEIIDDNGSGSGSGRQTPVGANLANILKQGIPPASQLKPTKPKEEKTETTSDTSKGASGNNKPPPVVALKPKRQSTKQSPPDNPKVASSNTTTTTTTTEEAASEEVEKEDSNVEEKIEETPETKDNKE